MKHLLDIRSLDKDQIYSILERAGYYRRHEHGNAHLLRNIFVANLFFEASTRTRFSFEVAERQLGAEVLNFSENSSSRVKGETVYDTIRTLEAMGVKGAVIRLTDHQLLQDIKDKFSLSLINAGAGSWEHPTQCLLDLFSIQEHFGCIEGLTVGMIGDISHSRVAGSHLHALPKLGARLILSSPEGMIDRPADPIPDGIERANLDELLTEADVVMMLRIQHERHIEKMNISVEEYHHAYGLTKERAAKMKKTGVIMHPGPFNRGVEIDPDLVEAENSLIFKQVTNGVHIRMAVLEMILGGKSR